MSISVAEVKGHLAMRKFLRVPWSIYRDDSNWVAPLLRETRRQLDPQRNPFFQQGEVRLFNAFNGSSQPVGRLAVINNPAHKSVHNDAAGFFGFFECVDQIDVARSLVEAATEFLRHRGCTSLIGPVNLSTNDESGFLLESKGGRPTFMTNYCPSYYHRLMTDCGFTKAVDTLSYQADFEHKFPQQYERVLRRVLHNPAVSVRSFDRSNAERDIAVICELYNTSFQDTWGFVPMSGLEAQQLADSLLSFADMNLIWIAFYSDKPVGFILGIPDLNEVLADLNGHLFPIGFLKLMARRNHLNGMRVLALGVLPEYRSRGIESILVCKERQQIVSKPYRLAEFSVVMENNTRMRALIETFGFHLHRRYRIYRKEIDTNWRRSSD